MTAATTLTLLFAGLAGLINPVWLDQLWFSRSGIAEGQWWRLFTGHLVHLTAAHLVLNGLVFALLAQRIEKLAGPRHLATLLILLAPGISLGLLILVPQMTFYAGVSAINYGLLAWLALHPEGLIAGRRASASRIVTGALVLTALLAMCALQAWRGISLVPGAQSAATVAWQAHLLGITITGITSICTVFRQRWHNRAISGTTSILQGDSP